MANSKKVEGSWGTGFEKDNTNLDDLRKSMQQWNLISSDDDEAAGELAKSVYAWICQQEEEQTTNDHEDTEPKSVIAKEDIVAHARQYLDAYNVLESGGVLIIPTTIGYSLVAREMGTPKMFDIKGRSENKPNAIAGTRTIFETLFGIKVPSELPETTCMAFLKRLSFDGATNNIVPKYCKSPEGQVGIWLNPGRVATYLATRLWNQHGEVLVGSSCNRSGQGNPVSDIFALDCLDAEIRANVDLQVDIPHWGTPENSSKDGQWLSAPIYDMDAKVFYREGRQMAIVEKVAQALERTNDGNQ